MTNVNNCDISAGELRYDILEGRWADAGQFESLVRASTLVAQRHMAAMSRDTPVPVVRKP